MEETQAQETAAPVEAPPVAAEPDPVVAEPGTTDREETALEKAERTNDVVGEHTIKIKTLRKELDEKIAGIRALPLGSSRELSLAITKSQEAVMWLGEELKRVHETHKVGENPYPNSKDPSNTKIDPTADGLKF